jgi:hypothetical protein
MAVGQREALINNMLKPIAGMFPVQIDHTVMPCEEIELDFNKRQVYLSEKDEYLLITPQVVYDNDVSTSLDSTGDIIVDTPDKLLVYKRNNDLEEEFASYLSELHPKFEDQKHQKIFYLHHTDFMQDMWFYKFFSKLQASNVEVFGLKELKSFKYSPHKGRISTSVTSGQDWFDVEINVSFGQNQVSLKEIRKAVINQQQFIQLKDGSVGVLPTEWFHKLERYFRNGEIKDNKLEVSKLRFSVIDELFDEIASEDILLEVMEKRSKLANFKEIGKTQVPKEITAELRPYQKEGVNWLNFLDEMGWGGILADDMGLGKTLQILTFIQHLATKEKSTHLVIVPTTLLFNWQNEIKKFAPQLKAHYHYGIDRAKEHIGFEDYNIVFTTYGVLLRDVQWMREFPFHYVILDESQAIKNPASRRFKAVNVLNAKNRLTLTGTPIENSTFDLFAQMTFVNRGFFGSALSFKEQYSNPIDKDGNELVADELHRLVNPFIMRRTKEKVASELPPKTEDIIYCEMGLEQRKVYDTYKNKVARSAILLVYGTSLKEERLKPFSRK